MRTQILATDPVSATDRWGRATSIMPAHCGSSARCGTRIIALTLAAPRRWTPLFFLDGATVCNGPDAVRMLRAMNAGVLGMVRAGHDVIVDGEAYEPEVNAEFHRQLRGEAGSGAVDCSIVELTADVQGLLDRQQRHTHRLSWRSLSHARDGYVRTQICTLIRAANPPKQCYGACGSS